MLERKTDWMIFKGRLRDKQVKKLPKRIRFIIENDVVSEELKHLVELAIGELDPFVPANKGSLYVIERLMEFIESFDERYEDKIISYEVPENLFENGGLELVRISTKFRYIRVRLFKNSDEGFSGLKGDDPIGVAKPLVVIAATDEARRFL